jgi:sec-independent protein translocase protein TatA
MGLGLGWLEIALIILVVIVLFGAKRLPELGASLGKSLRGFKDELQPPETDSDSWLEEDRES